MRDILPDLERWTREPARIALATVIQTWGSSPRRVGAKMAVTSDGKMAGSVSGGCVENAVVEAARDSLVQNQARLLHFAVPDENAWSVGLACGGALDVFVNPLDVQLYSAARAALLEETPAVLVTVVSGPHQLPGRAIMIEADKIVCGSLGKDLDQQALMLSRDAGSGGASRRIALTENVEAFLEVLLPPPNIIMVGGAHIAIALAALAKTVGYRTILIDPRQAWANAERFPSVDQLISAWPEEAFGRLRVTASSAVAMLTHDPKLDDPAIKLALSSPAFYVGALGSRATNARRRERLLRDGLTESQLDRLHAPIGLEIGADSPEEIALAIMAEVVEARRARVK